MFEHVRGGYRSKKGLKFSKRSLVVLQASRGFFWALTILDWGKRKQAHWLKLLTLQSSDIYLLLDDLQDCW